mmetsp:Transcript_5213/g.6566  ORF Transcript_5213/g.6566 Transcript_5213/m.6566 type:complete len:227 (-) Transcript_5213:1432-2112(-)
MFAKDSNVQSASGEFIQSAIVLSIVSSCSESLWLPLISSGSITSCSSSLPGSTLTLTPEEIIGMLIDEASNSSESPSYKLKTSCSDSDSPPLELELLPKVRYKPKSATPVGEESGRRSFNPRSLNKPLPVILETIHSRSSSSFFLRISEVDIVNFCCLLPIVFLLSVVCIILLLCDIFDTLNGRPLMLCDVNSLDFLTRPDPDFEELLLESEFSFTLLFLEFCLAI